MAFANAAHAGQLRKDGRTPYVVHPVGVLRFLSSDLGVTESALLVAALLHDVVEDTEVKNREVRREFGTEVAELVQELTIPRHLHGPNVSDALKTRALTSAVGTMSWPAILVKLGDRYDNLSDMANAAWSPKKRANYRGQTRAILRAFERRWRREPPPTRLRASLRNAAAAVRGRVEMLERRAHRQARGGPRS